MASPKAFDGMMHEFDVELGWCGSNKDGMRQHVSDFIPEAGPVSAAQFARWLVAAEGLNPDQLSAAAFRQLTAVFVKHMGADVTDASNLRSKDPGA